MTSPVVLHCSSELWKLSCAGWRHLHIDLWVARGSSDGDHAYGFMFCERGYIGCTSKHAESSGSKQVSPQMFCVCKVWRKLQCNIFLLFISLFTWPGFHPYSKHQRCKWDIDFCLCEFLTWSFIDFQAKRNMHV